MLAVEKGFNWTALEPQLALALARATRDTLMAEEKAAKLRVHECENLLETLKDSVDDAQVRLEDANHQVGTIISFLDEYGVDVNFRPLQFEPSPLSDRSSDSESCMDPLTDSDYEPAPDERSDC